MGGRRLELEALRAHSARVWGISAVATATPARRGATVLSVLGAVFAAVGLVGLAGAGVAGSASVSPTVVEGNPTCTDLGYPSELKVDPPTSGVHSDGTLTVTVDIDGALVDWTSDIGVDAVIVKGGPVANVYTYVPPSTGDDDLVTATNPSNDAPYGLSHLAFCYGTPTTTTTGATTTTSAPATTTTTGAGETTTTTGASSTTSSTVLQQGGTTTTTEVSGTETTPPTTAGGSSVTVQQTPTTAPTGPLPRTGSDSWPLFLVGVLLLATGARFAASARRGRAFDLG
jgi:hypothetical protein